MVPSILPSRMRSWMKSRDRAEEQGNAGSQQRTQKHEGSKDDTKLQIHDTPPNKHECRNSRRKYVDYLRGGHGLEKSHAEKQYKGCSEHRDITAAEKASVDCQQECDSVPGNYPTCDARAS